MKISKLLKRSLLALSILIVAFVVVHIVAIRNFDRLINHVAGDSTRPPSETAERLHYSSLVIDLHSDALMWNRSLLQRNPMGHVDLPRLIDGGVALQVFSAGTNMPLGPSLFNRKSEAWPDYYTFHAMVLRWPKETWSSQLQRAIYMADRLQGFVAGSGSRLRLIRTQQDLDVLVSATSKGQRLVGSLLALEGAHALEGKLSNLDVLYNAGFRIIGLTHFIDNPFAGSANGMKGGGLTPLGRELLREMERLGMVPDLAHASSQTIQDVVAATEKPVLVSHTGLRATCDKDRNLSDDEIQAIAKSGGVIGISFGEILICGDRIEDVLRSIQHVVSLVGDEHVALGSDFDGGITAPFDVSGLPALTQALLDAGFSEESIRRILGQNTLRVLRAWLRARDS